MTGAGAELALPDGLTRAERGLVRDLAARYDDQHGARLLGLVLTGSGGRGLATRTSDLDVYVVLADGSGRVETVRTRALDELPIELSELEEPAPFQSPGWWQRWSFAWAPVLLDRTGGRLAELARRQATVDASEAEEILVHHDRLDGWLNYAYRCLKSDRAGRRVEARLDAAESVPWLLDTVFTLAGRVRPYHSYLPWELRTHPLPGWEPEELLGLVAATLDGDPAAVRATFRRVAGLCAAFDRERQQPLLTPVVDEWDDDALALLRGDD